MGHARARISPAGIEERSTSRFDDDLIGAVVETTSGASLSSDTTVLATGRVSLLSRPAAGEAGTCVLLVAATVGSAKISCAVA